MLHAGLTGGIATGKSTVSEIFREAGAVIIDADDIAHHSIRKGMPAWSEIVASFGQAILEPNGEINRPVLGALVFSDEKKKHTLNRIVHPRVRSEIDRQLAHVEKHQASQVIILDIPLLIEVEWHRELQEVILVYAPRETQRERLMQRDGLSYKAANARIKAQMPIEEKRHFASIIIDNSGALAKTRSKTLAVYKYLEKKLSDGVYS